MTKENSRQNSKKSGKTEKKKNTARKDTRISKTEKDNRERIKDEIAACSFDESQGSELVYSRRRP